MFSKSISWATVLLGALVVIAACVGGGVVIWGPPGALSFQEYLNDLKGFAVAVGVLGIGRGVKAGLENHALLNAPIDAASLIPPPSLTETPAMTEEPKGGSLTQHV